jgi:hypothetical protein
VVQRAPLVVEGERAQPEDLREGGRDSSCVLGLARHGRPGAVELLGPAVVREGLQRVEREAPRMRGERRERSPTADVAHPGTGADSRRDLGDRPVGDAQQHDVRALSRRRQPARGETRAHRAADAPARTDDVDVLDHPWLQFLADTGHPER